MRDERGGLWFTVCWSLGAAALVFALLPGAWPNPLPDGTLDRERGGSRLGAVAAAVHAACARGDLAAFRDSTTEAHRRQLAGQLAAVDMRLDAATLRAMGDPASGWLELPWLAGQVAGSRAAVAVLRPAGDGAQVLTFVWDGRRLRLDGSRHAVAVATARAAASVVADAVAKRSR